MKSDSLAPQTTEGDYSALQQALERYLKSERPIDSVLSHPDFQREGLRLCGCITRGADRSGDIFAEVCGQFLRHDIEGPPARPTARRAQSLRTTGLCTLDQFWAYFYESAKNLDRSLWRRNTRRQNKRPVYNLAAAELARVKVEGVSAEERMQLVEALDAVNSLEEKYRITYLYHLLGYSTREIAEIMGCTHVTVLNRLKVAIRKVLGR